MQKSCFWKKMKQIDVQNLQRIDKKYAIFRDDRDHVCFMWFYWYAVKTWSGLTLTLVWSNSKCQIGGQKVDH